MNKLDWKTKTGGILGGIFGLISLSAVIIMDPDPTWTVGTMESLGFIVGGFTIFGFGAKVQKLIDAIKK